MARHPKLDRIIKKMETGNDFKIDRKTYIEYTGTDIPQDKYYTEKKSSVSKKAASYGYKITVVPEILIFEKI